MKPTATTPLNRRQCLRRTAFAAGVLAVPDIIPASVLGADGATRPSNRLTLASIGLGIQGVGNMRPFLANPEVRVIAVCDVHCSC